jgi:diaminopimelate decarboxylase/aspartate kinase
VLVSNFYILKAKTMRIIVAKFGGTSVSSRKTWENILQIAKNHINSGRFPVLVCSARSQASNMLEQLIQHALKNAHLDLLDQFTTAHYSLAQELEIDPKIIFPELDDLQQWLTGIALLKHVPAKTHAQILSLGELMSTKLGQAFLSQQGLKASWYDARQAIHCEPHSQNEFENYCQARSVAKLNKSLIKAFSSGEQELIITQGFIAANEKQETVLLGRGGSDTSGALFAAILGAEKCEIWTDVPGMYTANPHQLPQARLLKQLNYDEAQEIASMGAKVLHPMAIAPVRQAEIPMAIKYTWNLDHPGTLITMDSDESAPPVKSIQIKSSITLLALEGNGMWQQVGFLQEVFGILAKYHFSINLISTAECQITLSLDGHSHDRLQLKRLLQELNLICKAKLIEPCSSISLIGHHIRRILPDLGPTFQIFNDQQIHLMSLAANDLSLNLVVDESKAEQLTQKLHQILIDNNPQSYYYSKSWQEEFNPSPEAPKPWWLEQKETLIAFGQKHAPCYVYNPKIVKAQIQKLQSLNAVDKIFYSVKANFNPELLNVIYAAGLSFECVSINEIQHLRQLFPNLEAQRILFTPNFAHRQEYETALELGVELTIDSLYPLENWGQIFQNQAIFLRMDPGTGSGHRKYVSTTGDESKFGMTLNDLPQIHASLQQHDIQVKGLHAHAGSGILSPELWIETTKLLLSLSKEFPHLEVINIGGGFGLAERPGQHPLDLTSLNQELAQLIKHSPRIKLWIEPGRFLVAESGIILAKATQEKTKNKVRFIGLDVGMNSLIRPALYGAYHPIINLSRDDDPHKSYAHVVGPICESADTLGYDRMLPISLENDIFLIANTGAYGFCMSSPYNLRPPAPEMLMPD